ncbi:MAG: cytochrome C [Burkholderiales bacterium]
MQFKKLAAWLVAASACLAAATVRAQVPEKPNADPAMMDSATCLGCHGNEGFSVPGADGKPRELHVIADKFGKSVHGKRACVECHKNITAVPHEPGTQVRVSCVECHESLWKSAQLENRPKQEYARLGVVVEQIDRYVKSIHARPSRADQSRTNATCYSCHDAHYVYPEDSEGRTEWRLSLPNTCGKCHAKQREEYATSVHGKAVLEDKNAYAAVCSNCHSPHDVESPARDSARLAIVKNCGNCHADSLKSYVGTYHGQVNRLGYAYTAKCYDCHGSHTVQRVADKGSTVHPENRLNTCQRCHKDATAGFVTFEPHATTHDFGRYPHVWVAAKFMFGLLIGVFLFFWTHTALWFYREYQDRKARKGRPHVLPDETLKLQPDDKQFQRFGPWWRLAHLVFALSVMTLVLTGMSVFFGDSPFSRLVMEAFGGPQAAAYAHRVAATLMLGIFGLHLVFVVARIVRNWRGWQWFGPVSLVPTLQDAKDVVAMFQWFFGLRARPVFDRWTYWEKFDYWAVFWGMAIIGGSGMMLAFPAATASVLPGWLFNVATIVHGEEAILAAVFLFTVHFFNNHFRPDKFPLDTVMFTGAVPLEEFAREHTLEYQRLVASGELSRFLVDAPSAPMRLGSRILGFTLIAFGLILLIFVMSGWIRTMTAA